MNLTDSEKEIIFQLLSQAQLQSVSAIDLEETKRNPNRDTIQWHYRRLDNVRAILHKLRND